MINDNRSYSNGIPSQTINESYYDKLLEALAPASWLVPVKSHKESVLTIDDTVVDENTKSHYINGFHVDPDSLNSVKIDVLALRYMQGLQLLDATCGMIDVSKLAYWKPSSMKAGNPISNVIDDNFNTFWQSDGLQPHEVEVTFSRIMNVSMIAIFTSMIADESYTPSRIKIYAGTSPLDAVFYKKIEIVNMNGWFVLTFEDNRENDKLLKCGYIRFSFPVNHENGKDTHIRGMRIYAQSTQEPSATKDLRLEMSNNKKLFTEFSLR
ncbi:hypothetical protein TPHA_0N01290 [Tetrapisispora phaffii CBS 4417]|uniref:DOC domain-containing protein n=1 Tax=Tetrapisispora phaffii (strain ATCC 24235 / CBS 4417 / NBRC 1672 / NRRL Y-8282 / UCD 70-5) TaxID=1071381 RepID=G8C182_TETPH|nr:hypothetical protein TPHA_0N01290 [Tetrapisispora phaffii CBS 4417]CCE65910.1 hypothetical protein TPHA_0N01290 [Tetrapisispora phaffii CBS 4417]